MDKEFEILKLVKSLALSFIEFTLIGFLFGRSIM